MEDRGIKVSRQKTEYRRLRADPDGEVDNEVKMQGDVLELVEDFKYLGSIVQAGGGSEKEAAKRIQAGWSAWRKITGGICDNKAADKVKRKIYKKMVIPLMLYGIEVMALTKRHEEKMEMAEMKMLRWSLGLKKPDRIRNEMVKERLGIGKLCGQVRERLRWFGHVERRDDSYVGKRLRKMQVGKRNEEGREEDGETV